MATVTVKIGTQELHISDATGGYTINAEAEVAAIAELREGFGLAADNATATIYTHGQVMAEINSELARQFIAARKLAAKATAG
ncbi:MAG: hypothetical protein PHU85_02320 [Phycisphaerae bacterium]|nr:hypothetical protein [Phycisphaerae bacterium]